jgi:single-strand DNA-binding protein
MNNEINVTIDGWVAKPPQQYGGDGSRFVVFRIGSTPWWRDAQGERHTATTSWFDVKVGQPDMVENVLLSVRCGDPVVVSGRLSPHVWKDKDDKERVTMQIAARAVGLNLRWGKALFKRHATSPAGEAADREQPAESVDQANEPVPFDGSGPADSPFETDPAVEEGFNRADAVLGAP